DHAKAKMIKTSIILLKPLTGKSIASLNENNFCCIPINSATTVAAKAAIKIDIPPSDSPIAVKRSFSGYPPVHKNKGGMRPSKTTNGTTIFLILGVEFSDELLSVIDTSEGGWAPSRNNLPVVRARYSAFAIGPKSHCL